MSAHLHLRTATRADHERTDQAFGRFDLRDRDAYGAFLTAHARVLPAMEAVLAGRDLPAFRLRTPALYADLAELGLSLPPSLEVEPPAGSAAAWGMLYVIEGSRLGGAMLARTVGPDLPTAYLSARHEAGAWRGFCDALDAAAEGDGWLEAALDGARRTFRAYEEAATLEANSAR